MVDDNIQAKPILKGGKISELLDPSLGFDYDKSQIERMVLAATLCIRQDPTFRPQINLVSLLLCKLISTFLLALSFNDL